MKVSISGLMSDDTAAPNELLAKAKWFIEDESIATIQNNKIVPIKAGTTNVIVTLQGLRAKIPLTIGSLAIDRIQVDTTYVSSEVGSVLTIDVS